MAPALRSWAASALSAGVTALDPACWPPYDSVSYEQCCHPYSTGGQPGCWQFGYSFAQCCMPKVNTTAAVPLRVPESRATGLPLPNGGKNLLARDSEVVAGREFQVSWNRSWSCPPPAALHAVANTSQLLPGCPESCPPARCEPHPAATDGLWTVVWVLQTSVASRAQTNAHNPEATRALAAALRLAAAFTELRCVLLFWGCVGEDWVPAEALFDICAYMRLVCLELAALGLAVASVAQFEAQSGMCEMWLKRADADHTWLAELAEPFVQEVVDDLDQRGIHTWHNTASWDHLTGKAAAQRGGLATLVHPSLAPDVVPACAELPAVASQVSRSGAEEQANPWSLLAAGHGPRRGVTGGLTWSSDIAHMLQAIGVSQEPFVINLGAHDGGCHEAGNEFWNFDPANCLVEHYGFGGVLVEGSAETFAELKKRFHERRDDIGALLCTHAFVEPDTIFATLLAAPRCDGGPPDKQVEKRLERINKRLQEGDVELLKIDLDYGDCDFAERLVVGAGLRPRLVHVEVNPLFPPPVAFRQRFSGALFHSKGAGEPEAFMETLAEADWAPWRIGCSVSAYQEALGGASAYSLLQMEFDHALFVRSDLVEKLSHFGTLPRPIDVWLESFHCEVLRPVIRRDDEAAGFDFRRWASACVPPGGGQPAPAALEEALASMRELLARDGAAEVPRGGGDFAPTGKMPYSLWISESL